MRAPSRRATALGLAISASLFAGTSSPDHAEAAQRKKWRLVWHECEGVAPAETGCTIETRFTEFAHPEDEGRPWPSIGFSCFSGERGDPIRDAWLATNGFNGEVTMDFAGERGGTGSASVACDGIGQRFGGGGDVWGSQWHRWERITVTVEATGVGPWGAKVGIFHPWIPGAPKDVVASRTASHAARLTFRASKANKTTITGYLARCRLRSGGGLREGTADVSPIRVRGLEAGREYRCWVRADSNRGPGVWSKPVRLRAR